MVWLYSVVFCCIPTSGEMVPNQFSPHGQVVPKNSVPLDKWSLEYSICPKGQTVVIRKYRDQIGWGPFVQGYQICFV